MASKHVDEVNKNHPGLKDYAELARISNLPTCFTNVMVGCAVVSVGAGFQWSRFLVGGAAVALVYLGGMVMNDVVDVEDDRINRPHRPIPSGRVPVGQAKLLAGFLLVSGPSILFVLGARAGIPGAALAGLVCLYNLWHKRNSWAVVLMGGCRGLVYLTAAGCVAGARCSDLLIALAVIISVYTAVLTFIARNENKPEPGTRRLLSWGLFVLVLAPGLFVNTEWRYLTSLIGAAVLWWDTKAAFLLWGQPPRTKNAVLMWLSGICLADAYYLSLLGRPALSVSAVGGFLLTVTAHRRIAGT